MKKILITLMCIILFSSHAAAMKRLADDQAAEECSSKRLKDNPKSEENKNINEYEKNIKTIQGKLIVDISTPEKPVICKSGFPWEEFMKALPNDALLKLGTLDSEGFTFVFPDYKNFKTNTFANILKHHKKSVLAVKYFNEYKEGQNIGRSEYFRLCEAFQNKNPNPTNFLMARVLTAIELKGEDEAESPFLIVSELAQGEDIYNILNNSPDDIQNALKSVAEYFGSFHARTNVTLASIPQEDRQKIMDDYKDTIAKYEVQMRTFLEQEVGEVLNNLKNDEYLISEEESVLFKANLQNAVACFTARNLHAFQNHKYFLATVHGDNHLRNMFSFKGSILLPYLRDIQFLIPPNCRVPEKNDGLFFGILPTSFFNFSVKINETFGLLAEYTTAIDYEKMDTNKDPAIDVAIFIASLWQWGAHPDRIESLDELSQTIYAWEKGFIQKYLESLKKNLPEENKNKLNLKFFNKNIDLYKNYYFSIILNDKYNPPEMKSKLIHLHLNFLKKRSIGYVPDLTYLAFARETRRFLALPQETKRLPLERVYHKFRQFCILHNKHYQKIQADFDRTFERFYDAVHKAFNYKPYFIINHKNDYHLRDIQF